MLPILLQHKQTLNPTTRQIKIQNSTSTTYSKQRWTKTTSSCKVQPQVRETSHQTIPQCSLLTPCSPRNLSMTNQISRHRRHRLQLNNNHRSNRMCNRSKLQLHRLYLNRNNKHQYNPYRTVRALLMTRKHSCRPSRLWRI